METKSTKAQMRTWIETEICGTHELQIPDLVNRATDHFTSDRKFLEQFFRENIRDLVYVQVQQIVAGTRAKGNLICLGDQVMDRETFEKKAKKRSVFETWLEHVTDRHVLLLDMNRSDLLSAAEERFARGRRETQLGQVWTELANGLTGEQTVRDVFPLEAIEAIYNRITKEESSG